MSKTTLLVASVLLSSVCAVAQNSTSSAQPGQTTQAQTTPPPQGNPPQSPPSSPTTPPPATPAAPAAPTWSIGGIDFSGTFDGYYSFNNNHPPEALTYGNQLYNFDDKANSFDLNMIKLTASHDPDPIGFRFDFGFGRAFDQIHLGEQAPEIFRYVEQAYVSWKPAGGKGFEADFGDFVTSAGAEVIESKDNWNYSRSLLFSWAIPYYHMGLRTSIPIKAWTVGLQVVNGWNDITDNNSGKTIGVTAGITKKKFAWSNNYYVGPEKTYISSVPHSGSGNRNLYDTTLLLTPLDAFNAYINFDYGEDHAVSTLGTSLGHTRWVGIAGAAHFQVNKFFAVSPRFEWYDDADGFTTGTRQKLHEVTLTGEYKMLEGLLARLEYRRDDSNQLFFYRGDTPDASKTQTTVTLGVVAFFGPKR